MKAKEIRFKFLKEYKEKLEVLKEKLKNNDEAYSILGDEFTSVNREYEQLMWDITSKTFKQSYRIGSIAGNKRYLQDATLNWAVVNLYDEVIIVIPYIKAMENYRHCREGILDFCKNIIKVIDEKRHIYSKSKFYTEQEADEIFNEFFRFLEPESIKTHPEAEQKVINFYNNYKKFLVVLNHECED